MDPLCIALRHFPCVQVTSAASLERINNHLIMYKINPRVFVAPGGGGNLGAFLARGRTGLQVSLAGVRVQRVQRDLLD